MQPSNEIILRRNANNTLNVAKEMDKNAFIVAKGIGAG